MTDLDDLASPRAHRQRAALLEAVSLVSHELGGPRVIDHPSHSTRLDVDSEGPGAVDLDDPTHVARVAAILRGTVARRQRFTGIARGAVFGRGDRSSYALVHRSDVVQRVYDRLVEHVEHLDGPRWRGPCRGCGHARLGGAIYAEQCPECSRRTGRAISGRIGPPRREGDPWHAREELDDA